VFAGNRIKAIDMYNFLCDPAVEMVDLHKDGEWCAEASMVSHYGLKSRCLEGRYFNCEMLSMANRRESRRNITKIRRSKVVSTTMTRKRSHSVGIPISPVLIHICSTARSSW
jgi:hypothetical protein